MKVQVSKASVQKTYEEIAARVEERRQVPWPDVVDFEKTIPRQQTVLDLGCGSGRNAAYFVSLGHKVIALDFVNNFLKKAKQRIGDRPLKPLVNFLQADVMTLPLRDSSVDICLHVATLHHLPIKSDRMKSLTEMKRCLKIGGKALISVWAFEQKRFQTELKKHQTIEQGFGDVEVPIKTLDGAIIKRFYHLFMDGELNDLLSASGFKIERCFKSHDNYFAMVVK